MLDARPGHLPLGLGLQEEFVHFAHGQTLGQVVVGAVLAAAVMTMALGFAAGAKALDDRGAQNIGRNPQLLAEPSFPVTESQRRFS